MTMRPNEVPSEATIFEQDGKVYVAISNTIPARERAKLIANEIRYMLNIPRSRMRIVPVDEFRKMPFGKPSKEGK